MNVMGRIQNVKLGMDNVRLTALLCATLDAVGGSVTLTKEQSEKVWEGATLQYEQEPDDGGITIRLVPQTPH